MDAINSMITEIFLKVDLQLFYATLFSVFVIMIGILAFFLIRKTDKARELKSSLNKLTRSFNDLDEQAKLIVRTDLALNKAQRELDKRLSALNALHKTSSLISTTLDPEEIFHRLGKSLISELGFEKNIIFTFDESKNLRCRSHVGFSKEAVEHIVSALSREHTVFTTLREGSHLSSFNAPKQKKERITQIFGLEHFILSPILSQDGTTGILFVGNQSDAMAITQGDEELISILLNQIGQSLENAQLFEEVYRSRQELESKIQDRTKELSSALEQLKKISKAKSDFVSAVSHELRTPLTSIKGYASILMAGKIGEIPKEVKERLEKVNKHSDNLVKFINDLLDISRIESGRVEMKLQKQNIPALIDNIRDLLAPQLKEKNIKFSTHINPQTPDIFADSSQIERVFINLLGNAIKFTPENGSIDIRTKPDGDFVIFEISDTGVGISESDLQRLFEEFYRVENEINQNVKGTGLGLALVKNIIEAHQGKIWVTSKLNAGTIFHFTLPAKPEEPA